jgi:hypothetical protein
MTLKRGQRVLTPHPTMMGPQKVEGRYVGGAPPHRIGPTLDGYMEHVEQGIVEYADGTRKTWPVDAIEAAPGE